MQKYKRVLLKLSGEAIAKKDADGHIDAIFDEEIISEIADIIKRLIKGGTQVGVVIGAGNIWRGAYAKGLRRARADQMGMLGTMINCLRLEDAVEKTGIPVKVFSPIQMNSFAEPYNFRSAVELMEKGGVAILGSGSGMPFVTTDTAVVVRGSEIDADVILMAKNIDGIYERDPRGADGEIDPTVPRYKVVSYDECLRKGLRATDISASAIAKEQKINMYVFALSDPENIIRAAQGEEIGTLVTYDDTNEPEMY